MPTPSMPGALVISLDFELYWGMRDLPGIMDRYVGNLRGERDAVPAILKLFGEFGIAATWATVGLLFASGRAEAEAFSPVARPRYHDPRLDAYQEPLGASEDEDPLHFAPSLVEMIRRSPRQELATHTYSHYYCREPGQDREAFAADLAAAVRIAGDRGIRLRSIVFPRNQHNPAYDDVLRAHGITCYRGAQQGWIHGPGKGTGAGNRPVVRAARLLDAHLGLSAAHTAPWATLRPRAGLSNVPAGFFLRPVGGRLGRLHRLHVSRIMGALEHAARRGEVFHLWWHPHNFGACTEQNLGVLRMILDRWARWHRDAGMLSLGMAEAADHAVAMPG